MLVLAHRGYHAELPENTLAAFEAAVAMRVDGIETDVQVTGDGIPILFHDVTVQGQEIIRFSHRELCRLTQREVPTLVSALDTWPGIFWNLEIKMPTSLAAIWPVLWEYRRTRRLLVSSFWHPAAVQVGRELGLECALLVAHRPLSFTSLLAGLPDDLPADRVSVVWEYNGVDEGLIKAARAEGVRNYVYGPQTLAEHHTLGRWDVAGVITDYPWLAKSQS